MMVSEKQQQFAAMLKGEPIHERKLTKRQETNLIRWIKALISGDYQQGRSYLFRKKGTGFFEEVRGDSFSQRIWGVYKTDRYCGTGVALKDFGFPVFFGRFYLGWDADCITKLWPTAEPPYHWFVRTFGLTQEQVCSIHGKNDAGITFAGIAAYLIHFLPHSNEKVKLALQIADKLETERAERQKTEAMERS
jgi:hypothetical protein